MAANQKDKNSKPVFKPKTRQIKPLTRLFLYVQAGGRCEFDGCNRYLLEQDPTERIGNFAEMAHIWAFSDAGPRGLARFRPGNSKINDLGNLVLLCPGHHKEVDDHPDEYPVGVLRKFKQDHECRVYDLTEISKDRDTVPLVIKGLVAGRAMDISDEEMQLAVAPNYIKRRLKVEIDLTQMRDGPDTSYWEAACRTIDHKLARLHEDTPTKSGRALQVSVFALARIPLLIYAGSRLSDKLKVDIYQRHRVPVESWAWKAGEGDARYLFRQVRNGTDDSGAVLLINLSGRNDLQGLPSTLSRMSAYELTLDGKQPSQLFLNCSSDLARFREAFMNAMATIRQECPRSGHIHLFPAVPAPVAIAIGRDRLPNADPPFLVYDRDKDAADFVPTLEVK